MTANPPGQHPLRSASWALLGLSLAALFSLLLFQLTIGRKFKLIFVDLLGDTDPQTIPWLTRLFVMQSPRVYVLAALLLAVLIVAKEIALPGKGLTLGLNLAACLLVLLLFFATVVACFVPWESIMTGSSV